MGLLVPTLHRKWKLGPCVTGEQAALSRRACCALSRRACCTKQTCVLYCMRAVPCAGSLTARVSEEFTDAQTNSDNDDEEEVPGLLLLLRP